MSSKSEMASGYAWILSIVVPLTVMTICGYIAIPMRDENGYLRSDGGLIIMIGFIISAAVIIWTWTFHKVT